MNCKVKCNFKEVIIRLPWWVNGKSVGLILSRPGFNSLLEPLFLNLLLIYLKCYFFYKLYGQVKLPKSAMHVSWWCSGRFMSVRTSVDSGSSPHSNGYQDERHPLGCPDTPRTPPNGGVGGVYHSRGHGKRNNHQGWAREPGCEDSCSM